MGQHQAVTKKLPATYRRGPRSENSRILDELVEFRLHRDHARTALPSRRDAEGCPASPAESAQAQGRCGRPASAITSVPPRGAQVPMRSARFDGARIARAAESRVPFSRRLSK